MLNQRLVDPSAIRNEDRWTSCEFDGDNRSVFLEKGAKIGLEFEGGTPQSEREREERGAWTGGKRGPLAAVRDVGGEQDGKRDGDDDGEEVEKPILHCRGGK